MTVVRRRPVLDVDACAVSSTAGGPTEFDDPTCPWVVRIWAVNAAGRTRLARLEVVARDPATVDIGAAGLARLPTAQLRQVAAAHAHPDEVYYRMLARPRPPGQRSWSAEHWAAVATVAAWATATARPGGAVAAVADLWSVAAEPTARRWLSRVNGTRERTRR